VQEFESIVATTFLPPTKSSVADVFLPFLMSLWLTEHEIFTRMSIWSPEKETANELKNLNFIDLDFARERLTLLYFIVFTLDNDK